MSSFSLIRGSAVDQKVDAIVNAANRYLLPGGGICGVIYKMAGQEQMEEACGKIPSPICDGQAVVTPAFNIPTAKIVIHAVGPDFRVTSTAVDKLRRAYYSSLIRLMENDMHSISFPLISAGIFAGKINNPAKLSAHFCKEAYNKFREDFPEYEIDVLLCAFNDLEYKEALEEIK